MIALREVPGQRVLEGLPGTLLVAGAGDVRTVLEACFAGDIQRLLLYADNFSQRFFDLGTGEAGDVLQKLRNYHIRLAVVRSPALTLSRRFEELLVDERRGPYFRMFDERAGALEWLCESS